MKKSEMNKYIFKPYNPLFPKIFETEKNRLEKYLTREFKIEHFGSTSIPNLGGKGIIDIYIVSAKENLESLADEIVKAGYEMRSPTGPDKHRFFKQDLKFHIHLNTPAAEDFTKAIAFRDYLRNHPEDVEKYAVAKKKAAEEANEDKDKYMAIKSPVMKEILRKITL